MHLKHIFFTVFACLAIFLSLMMISLKSILQLDLLDSDSIYQTDLLRSEYLFIDFRAAYLLPIFQQLIELIVNGISASRLIFIALVWYSQLIDTILDLF